MRGKHLDGRLGFMALGIVLCLLAAVFAFEAKIAWFSPAGTPTAQISASKLQPADAPRLIAEALAAPIASQHFPSETPLLFAVALLLAPIAWFCFRISMPDRAEVYASSHFSPPLFRRPPPQF
jgi:hypothetical protein